LPDWHETTESMWYDDVLPLSKTALAPLFVAGMIYTRTHTTRTRTQSKRERKIGEEINYETITHVDIWTVDRECAFVLPDDHRHLSVNGIFLKRTGVCVCVNKTGQRK
jgi:hypothetical protein